MAKVNKAFSLDPEVFVVLDRYCMKHEEIGGKRKSRSAVVNNAIRWYLGDTANLVNQRDVLQRELRKRNIELEELKNSLVNNQDDSLVITRSWWRRLLGLN